MGRQISGSRHYDLPHPALVQVRRAEVGMVEDGLAVREKIDIISHEDTPNSELMILSSEFILPSIFFTFLSTS